MAGRELSPERVQAVLGYLEAGLNPMRAARAAGVSKSFVYRLDVKVSGVSRLAPKRAAAAHLIRTMGVSERFACRVTGQNRTTQRREPASTTVGRLRRGLAGLAARVGEGLSTSSGPWPRPAS